MITPLTKREIEVLKSFNKGTTNACSKLFICRSTYNTHKNNIYNKLLSHNKAQALITALKAGIISLEEIED